MVKKSTPRQKRAVKSAKAVAEKALQTVKSKKSIPSKKMGESTREYLMSKLPIHQLKPKPHIAREQLLGKEIIEKPISIKQLEKKLIERPISDSELQLIFKNQPHLINKIIARMRELEQKGEGKQISYKDIAAITEEHEKEKSGIKIPQTEEELERYQLIGKQAAVAIEKEKHKKEMQKKKEQAEEELSKSELRARIARDKSEEESIKAEQTKIAEIKNYRNELIVKNINKEEGKRTVVATSIFPDEQDIKPGDFERIFNDYHADTKIDNLMRKKLYRAKKNGNFYVIFDFIVDEYVGFSSMSSLREYLDVGRALTVENFAQAVGQVSERWGIMPIAIASWEQQEPEEEEEEEKQ